MTAAFARRKAGREQVGQSRGGGRTLPRFAALALGVLLADQAAAQGVRYFSPWRAEAPRRELIATLQYHRTVARQVLAAAESQAAMSEAELNAAFQKLSTVREALGDARADARQADQTLRAIEAEIVAAQPPDSQLGKAQLAFDNATSELANVVRRLNLFAPVSDVAKLSPAQRELLEREPAYRAAKRDRDTAAREVQRLRQQLFQADERWQAARQDLQEARAASREGNNQAKSLGVGSLGDKERLRTAQGLAANARAIIAFTEAHLRLLGVAPSTPSTASASDR